MDNQQGWVKLYRQITDWEWWDDHNTTRLFIFLLVTANHKDKKWRGILIKRGELISSLEKLSKATTLSKQTIRTSIKRLKSTQEVTQYKSGQYTHLKVNNYDKYQEYNTVANTQLTHSQHTANTQLTTNKNEKNEKNEKKYIRTYKSFKKYKNKILAEAKMKYPDKNCEQAIEDFMNYCETKTTKYKNYKQAFFLWVGQDRFDQYKIKRNKQPLKERFAKYQDKPSGKMQKASDILDINKYKHGR